ncbi:diacylglycerol kinase family protein [Streptomyces sp. NPDC023838]|uniref:diacylglycerol kinase family protein n=1 Tax=Streptomyces sp. NPDC023838 TaxID=3154325 RepID=UPI0033F8523D
MANPATGTHSREMAQEVARRIAGAGTPVEPAVTERPGHAQQLARTAGGPGGPAALVRVGGDGTAHEIMTGLLAGREERHAALLYTGSAPYALDVVPRAPAVFAP